MNKLLAICFFTAPFMLLGCSENKIENKLKEAIKARMRDPSSAQFRNTTIDAKHTYTERNTEHLLWDIGGKKGPEPKVESITYTTELVCIEANGKNAFGAYSGFKKFCGFQYRDGTYSGYDVEEKESYEAAMRNLNAIGDQLNEVMAVVKKRGYMTPSESAKNGELLYNFKQAQREVLEKSISYQIPIADNPK